MMELALCSEAGERCRGRIIEAPGFKLYVPPDLVYEVWANIIHVVCLDDYMLLRLHDRPRSVVDAGAFVGVFALHLLRNIGAERVVAVEPSPRALSLLKTNLELNNVADAVEVVEAALAPTSGEAVLHVAEGLVNSSLLREYPPRRGRGIVARLRVRTVTLGELLEQPFSLLKLDIEGMETAVLRSAVEQGVLSPYRAAAVVVELHSARDLAEAEGLLREAGYRILGVRRDEEFQQYFILAAAP